MDDSFSDFTNIIIIFVIFSILYCISLYLQVILSLKQNYQKHKCNPLVMPFAASISGENPKDVFTDCLSKMAQEETDKTTSQVFSSLSSGTGDISSLNEMQGGSVVATQNFSEGAFGPPDTSSMGTGGGSTGAIPDMLGMQKQIEIQTSKLAYSLANILQVTMAFMRGTLKSVESLPVMAEGVINSPPIQMVTNVGRLAGN